MSAARRCRAHLVGNAPATAFTRNAAQAARQQWRRAAGQPRSGLPRLAVLPGEAGADPLAPG